jgi:cell division ATPase FtsA
VTEVVPIKRDLPSAEQPDDLSRDEAQRVIRLLAADTRNIVVLAHGKQRMRQRAISRPQIERCIQKGVVSEGPFVNLKGQWQANMTRYAAGEEITCVVAIDWVTRLIVITTF